MLPSGDRDPFKDEDVLAEEGRVQSESPSEVAVHITDACKIYDRLPAVKKVSFTVNNGEVFSLLGVNGAGKTTMFKMITMQEVPTAGTFYIHGIDMYSNISNNAKRFIGYCPQDDILFDCLSVKEHLEFYARVRGIPAELQNQIINTLTEGLHFGENANKQAWKLSGGNKRKLCSAISLLGHPAIILMDEPTTGLDPKSRREVWELIRSQISGEHKSAVVLTSHSMEEVEALSTKMGIMVAGNFRCFGSGQHLKSKYGNSFNVEYKLVIPDSESIKSMIQSFQIDLNQMINNIAEAQSFLKSIDMSDVSNIMNDQNKRASYIKDKVILYILFSL